MREARDMLPELPQHNTALMRCCLGAQGVLDELDLLASDLIREGDPEAADEVRIARARVYRVLASRIAGESVEMEARR